MNIFLLNPFGRELNINSKRLPSIYLEEPLGLMYIYSYMKKHSPNHRLNLYDASLLLENSQHKNMDSLWDELKKEIEKFSPNIVAMSALYYSNADIVHKTAHMIKEIDQNIVVAIGGSYPTHLPATALQNGDIDYCVFSEGEHTFQRLVNALDGFSSLDDIDGIAYRDEDGRIVINDKKSFINNLDSIPFPDRDAVPFEKYLTGGRRVIYRYYSPKDLRIGSITSSRGCPYKCTFCGSKAFWGQHIRFRTPESVIEEMIEMKDKYGVNTFVFNDDNMCVDKKRFMKFLDLIIKNLPGIKWLSGGGLNVRAINDDEIIKKMYKSGICLFNLALESGKNETLRKIHKVSTVEEIQNVVELIRKEGDIPIHGFFIIGFPFETIEDMHVTIDFAKKLDLDWANFYNFQPFPGSELYELCVEDGAIDKFDINYGENYLPSNVNYSGFTSTDVSQINYDANIDLNFINNRNLIKNPKRALSDFNYVLSLVPDHYIAIYCKAVAYRNLGDEKHATECFESIKESLSQDSVYYDYFIKYNLLDGL